MVKFIRNRYNFIIEICSYIFILLFVYAAVSKFLVFEQFQVQLGQSPLLSAFADYVAWGIPVIEILVAILISIPNLRFMGILSFFTLMAMFTTYIVIILNFTDFIPCSCGGVLEDLGWTEHLIFNIFFIVLAIITLFLQSKTYEPMSLYPFKIRFI